MTRTRQRSALRLLVVVVALLTVASAGIAPLAAAQEDGPPVPPHRYFGTVTDTNGNPVSGERVTVTYEGAELANDTTDADGYYDLQAPQENGIEDGDEVTITVDGVSETATWERGGGTEVNFEIEAETPTPTPEPGDGDDGDDGDDDAGGDGGGGGGAPAAPAPEPETDVEGDAAVDADVTGQTLSAEITSAATGSAVTTAFGEATVDETLTDTGAALNSLTTEFADDVSNAELEASYSATNPSEDVPDLPAAANVDAAAYVNVDTDVAEDDLESVTFEFSVSRDRLSEAGLEPGEVSLYRYNGGEYTELDASIDSEGDDRITYTAESPGLSVFAIGEETEQVTTTATPEPDTATPTPDTAAPEPDTDTPTETQTTTDTGTPGFGPVVAITALLALAFAALRRRE